MRACAIHEIIPRRRIPVGLVMGLYGWKKLYKSSGFIKDGGLWWISGNRIITGSSRHPMDKLMKKLRKSRKLAKVRGRGRVRA
jgi:hypothetical protein